MCHEDYFILKEYFKAEVDGHILEWVKLSSEFQFEVLVEKLFPIKFCYIFFFESLRICADTVWGDDTETHGLISVNRLFDLRTPYVGVFLARFFVALIFFFKDLILLKFSLSKNSHPRVRRVHRFCHIHKDTIKQGFFC